VHSVDHSITSGAMAGKSSTSKHQESSVFHNDSSEDAEQEITDAVHCCLQLLQKSKYITNNVNNIISLCSKKWEVNLEK
jgi:hypothetical protein